MTEPRSAACLPDERIAELAEGLLSADELRSVEMHLAECPACRALAAQVARTLLDDGSHDGSHGAPQRAREDLVLEPIGAAAYEVGREIARGGMGRILEAWDRRHGRRVAVKVLLKNEPHVVRRFLREVRITARLQHPAIVPLYEAGLWPDGEPFFAMRFVAGRPLDEVVAATPALRDRLALLPHVVALTSALAYAHEQRIVHRDLKPSNVLVGAFGETVVIDWGLAKALDSDDADGDEHGSEGSDATLTAAGHALGTPCYMPPEQARGLPIDERADVYALGALLHHVLAGEAPFAGSSAHAVLAKVLVGPPAPLESRVPQCPPELLAIVGKAMQRDPERRYPTAKAMAEDLERYAAGQLVSAHRYSAGALLRRWVARHRAAFATAAALVLGASVAGGLGVRSIALERDRADALAVVAESGRTRAVEHRNAAEELVGFMVGSLKTTLETVGRLDAMAGVGNEVRRYYDRVDPSADGMDASTLGRRAAALEALAEVEEQKQHMEVALSLYQGANRLHEAELRSRPGDLEPRAHAAANAIRIASIQVDRSAIDDALRTARDALRGAEDLAAREPSNAGWQMLAARAHRGLGGALSAKGDAASARAEVTAALAMADRAAATDRTNAAWQAELARTHFFVAYAEMGADRYEAALREFRASTDIWTAVVERDPRNAKARRELAWGLLMLGRTESQHGRAPQAVEDAGRARKSMESLTARDPENADWQRDLFVADFTLCQTQHTARLLDAADATCRTALPIAERLTTLDPSSTTARDDLGHVLTELASGPTAPHRPRDALEAATAALRSAEEHARMAPGDHGALAQKGAALALLARIELSRHRADAARDHYLACIAVLDERDRRFPGFDDGRSLAQARTVGGEVEIARRAFDAARPLLVAAEGTLRKLLDADPGNAELARELSRCRADLARLPAPR